MQARLVVADKGDSCIHEVGHALLFAPWIEVVDPKVRVTMSATQHDLPTHLVMAPANRPWLMLVCLAGRAAEVVAGRNGELLKDAKYVRALDWLSSDENDGPRWLRIATEELQLGRSASTREGRRRLEARRQADMAALVRFFDVNRQLLEATAERLLREGFLEPNATAQLLSQVVFTDRVSPDVVEVAPADSHALTV